MIPAAVCGDGLFSLVFGWALNNTGKQTWGELSSNCVSAAIPFRIALTLPYINERTLWWSLNSNLMPPLMSAHVELD